MLGVWVVLEEILGWVLIFIWWNVKKGVFVYFLCYLNIVKGWVWVDISLVYGVCYVGIECVFLMYEFKNIF